MPRVLLFLSCLLALALPARAQAPLSWPATGSPLVPTGSEAVFVDLALMPSTYYRLDALGQAVPGLRLSTWANLASRSFLDGRLRLNVSMRLDLDTGATERERSAFPGLAFERYQILSGFVEYDATRWLTLRAGRQFYADMADFLAFDGGLLALKLPALPVRLEVYGGVRSSFAVTEGSTASSLYELDGVAQINGSQPLVGATARWVGSLTRRQEGSVGYRQSWHTDGDEVSLDPLLPKGPYVTAQEVVASFASDIGPVHLALGGAYEIVLGRLMRARGALVVPVSRLAPLPGFARGWDLDAALEYQRFQPTFALDSIWNFFSTFAFDELALATVVRVAERRVDVRLFGRAFRSATEDRGGNPLLDAPGVQLAEGFRLSVVEVLRAKALLDYGASLQAGYGGRRALLDSGLRVPVLDEKLETYGRLYLTHWDDPLRPENAGVSVGAVAGATYRLPAGASASVLVEETLSSSPNFQSKVPRVYAVLDLARWL